MKKNLNKQKLIRKPLKDKEQKEKKSFIKLLRFRRKQLVNLIQQDIDAETFLDNMAKYEKPRGQKIQWK